MSAPAKTQASLPLPFAEPVQPAPKRESRLVQNNRAAPRTRSDKLWLALHFPLLALEAVDYAKNTTTNTPAIVSEERAGRFVAAAVSACARDHGIAPGMPVNAAWALCPALQVLMREPSNEYKCLQKLANILYCYSSTVSVQNPNMLLVEVNASLRLFEGLETLVARIQDAIRAAGHVANHGVAPSVAGARLLAFAGHSHSHTRAVKQTSELASSLGRLPLGVLAPELPDLLPRLQKLGLRCLTDLFRLPRAGLRRRFGAELVAWIEQALGQRPELPATWTPPRDYRSELDLDEPLTDIGLLFPAIENLLQDFCVWLRANSLHCNGFVLHFYHYQRPATRLKIGLLHPASQSRNMIHLLNLRMQREQLPAPVIGLRLSSLRLTHAQAVNTCWWANEQGADTHWWQTLEALQARLGEKSVQTLACVHDWRPESAWRVTEPGAAGQPPCANRRPAWLFTEPRQLNANELARLQIRSRPERISSGWWDDQPLHRDYFQACIGSQMLWVYRCNRGWFAHGRYEK